MERELNYFVWLANVFFGYETQLIKRRFIIHFVEIKALVHLALWLS
jgi:hypothetical protein